MLIGLSGIAVQSGNRYTAAQYGFVASTTFDRANSATEPCVALQVQPPNAIAIGDVCLV
jgi:hypothetical protein